MKYKLVIFDMDGTILDTLDDLRDSMNVALEKMNYPSRSLNEIRSFVGDGLRKLVERCVPEGTSEEDCDRVLSIFKDHYKDHCYDRTRVYDGILPLIKKLREAGFATAVVSNKDDAAVKKLCDMFFVGLFDAAIGSRKDISRKPAPDMVSIILSELGFGRDEAIYVGDSEVDIKTAQNSKMDCITVLWGFRDKDFLVEKGANVIVSAPEEIYTLLSGGRE